MESNLPAQPAYSEPDEFEADEPYLEAKLYIERVEQETNRCLEENRRSRTHEPLAKDGPESLEHGVSITVFPVRVPSMHFSCASVQWDMPHTPADAPSQDSSSIDKEQEQTDDDLQQEPTISTEADSCQLYDAHTEVNVCVTPPNEDDQPPFTETSQTSEVSDHGGLVENSEIESQLCIENPEIQPVPQALEVLEEESIKTGDIVLLTELEQGFGDAGETKEVVELISKDGISVIIMTPSEGDRSTTPQSETNDPVLELDSKQVEESGLNQESDPPQHGVPPDLVCDALEAVETEESENVELTRIANVETLELETAETFVVMQESVP
ncbi:hypothetical protein AMELA_G00253270 [Ameiurus melas]|uniref:Uncharacterized protein n=1 Tax=Ameiurus melas TaxID=219545 RepID=A0A7J5ZTF0_AMEME|nr:hypothetical protein AMELA_G00253270 [Ameiurus melas]